MTAPTPRLSLFDREPTAADQIGTMEALAVIVREAAKRKLAPLEWTVPCLGSSLVGRATLNTRTDGRYDYAATRTARRAAFDQYVDLLGWLHDQAAPVAANHGLADRFPLKLTVWPERTDGLGAVRLVAVLEHVTVPLGPKRDKWLLSVSVHADLEPDPEES